MIRSEVAVEPVLLMPYRAFCVEFNRSYFLWTRLKLETGAVD